MAPSAGLFASISLTACHATLIWVMGRWKAGRNNAPNIAWIIAETCGKNRDIKRRFRQYSKQYFFPLKSVQNIAQILQEKTL